MSRIAFATAVVVFLSGCVVTAHHLRPAWSPAWSTVEQVPAPASNLFNVSAQLYDPDGSPLAAGEVIAVSVSSEGRALWSLKTSDYLTEHGAQLRLSPGSWRIDVKPHAGIRAVSRTVVVQPGASYRVNFYTVFQGGTTIQ